MIYGIIGKKLGMTQRFGDKGKVEAVTAIEAGPCQVTQVKTLAKEGYAAVQLGFSEVKTSKPAEKGQLKGLGRFRYLREIGVDDTEAVKVGDRVDVSLLKAGDLVDIIGVSRGKGFAGVVKRYHFAGGLKTHGQSDRHRARGASGPDRPARVIKGMRMAGHMGNSRVTVRQIKVSEVDPERNLLLVNGAVPGGKNGLLLIRKSDRGK